MVIVGMNEAEHGISGVVEVVPSTRLYVEKLWNPCCQLVATVLGPISLASPSPIQPCSRLQL